MPRVRSCTGTLPVSAPAPKRRTPECSLRWVPRSPFRAWRSASIRSVSGVLSSNRCEGNGVCVAFGAGFCACAPPAAPRTAQQYRRRITQPKLRGYAVSASLFGPIQGLIGGLHHLFGRRVPMIALGDADADGDHDRLTTLATLVGPGLEPRPEPAPHGEPAGFDRLAQLLEVGHAFVLALAGVDEREFLAAVPIRGAAARCLREARRDEPEDVVSRIVPVGVVEALEVIDVDHGDRELSGESRQGFVQGATAGQFGQAVAVGHHVGGFDHGDDEYEPGGGEPDFLAGPGGR